MQIVYPWQQACWEKLTSAEMLKRPPHAILFCGQEGIGKFHLATLLAQALLCQHPSPYPCGVCRACQLLKVGHHPDLFIVQPEEKGKYIKITQIRDLISDVSQTAQQGIRQVVIISPAEALHLSAANALLKTLEEPPGDIILLLVSHSPFQLLPTIRSRCWQLNLQTPSLEMATHWLAKQNPLLEEGEVLLKFCNNAALKALDLAQIFIRHRVQVIQDWITWQQSKLTAFTFLARYKPKNYLIVVLCLLSIVMDCIKLSLFRGSEGNDRLINDDYRFQLFAIIKQLSPRLLFKHYDQLLQLRQWITTPSNVNIELQLTALLCEWEMENKRC